MGVWVIWGLFEFLKKNPTDGGGGHLKFHNLEIKALDALIFFLKKLYLLRANFLEIKAFKC